MERKRCFVELVPDERLGWAIKPGPECEETFKEVAEKQGPHAKRYLNVRTLDQSREATGEQLPENTTE
jgi:hypothetical protein